VELEDIYETVKDAERAQKYLISEAYRFESTIDAYYHTTDGECSLEHAGAVDRERVLEETQYFVNVLEGHEEMLGRLEEAREELTEYTSKQVVGEESIDVETLRRKAETALDHYKANFNEAMGSCGRVARDPTLPNPQVMKSLKNQSYNEGSLEDLMKLL